MKNKEKPKTKTNKKLGKNQKKKKLKVGERKGHRELEDRGFGVT